MSWIARKHSVGRPAPLQGGMRRVLQVFVVLCGISAIFISLLHIVFGPAVIPGSIAVNATMDSEDRFYATLLTAYGVALLWCARGIEQKSKLLERGCGCADAKVAQFCANLLALEPALWRFAGVLWRKNAFGCNSHRGCRFVERMLTVIQTLRLQGRNVLHFLVAAVCAHRAGEASPKLVIVG